MKTEHEPTEERNRPADERTRILKYIYIYIYILNESRKTSKHEHSSTLFCLHIWVQSRSVNASCAARTGPNR